MAEALSYDDIILNQRKEKKDLTALVQKMKHSVSKGDKKKKKEINAEISEMVAKLDLKHEEELKNFHEKSCNKEIISLEGSTHSSDQQDANEQMTTAVNIECTLEDETQQNILPKLSKAQKRRNRKAENAKERQKAIQEQEIQNLSGSRHLEMTEISKKLTERGLVLHEVPSDGNCLYNAIEHQLLTHNIKGFSMKSLRALTSEYLLSHKDEFIPFLTNPDTGDTFSDDQFEKYCNDVRDTAAWGGHVEIQALSHVCGKPIEVIQAGSPSIIAGNENDTPKLLISYHRHAFGLGEHYNSVIPG